MNEFWVGFICGMLVIAAGLAWGPSYHNQARTARLECEKNLPRNIQCKIVAIPEREAGSKP